MGADPYADASPLAVVNVAIVPLAIISSASVGITCTASLELAVKINTESLTSDTRLPTMQLNLGFVDKA